MLCNKCGTNNPDGSAFCVSCGAQLNAPQQAQQNTGYSQQPYQQPAQQQPVQQPYQEPIQQQYQQPVQQQYQQPQSPYPQQSYGAAPARDPRLDNPGSVKGAKVLYIIAGAIACLAFIMPFLPSISFSFGELSKYIGSQSYTFNVFTFGDFVNKVSSLLGASSSRISDEAQALSGLFIVLIAMFIIPMAIQIPWAILSFMRKRPAGVFGLISSILYFIGSIIWVVFLNSMYASAIQSAMKSGVSSIIAKQYFSITAVPYFMVIFAVAGIVLSIIQLVKKKYLR